MSKLNKIIRFIAENGETEYAHRLKFIKEISESIALEDETPEERKKREESEREREKESAERLKELEAEKKTGEEITKPSSEVSGPSRFWGGGGFLDVKKGLSGLGIPTSGSDVAKIGKQTGAGVLGAVKGIAGGIAGDLTRRFADAVGSNIPGAGAAILGGIGGAERGASVAGRLHDFEKQHAAQIKQQEDIINSPDATDKEKAMAYRKLSVLKDKRGRIEQQRTRLPGGLGGAFIADPAMRRIIRDLSRGGRSLGGKPLG
jgi:hypothetical protein